ncbi:MAG: chromosomal replication initiator protein DnaA [Clostridia bacterium]|nr:chromosomal replication initiator protein DnaA [Clostridia bacterium]
MDSFKALWQLVQNYLQDHMNEVAYSCWIVPLEPICLTAGEATLFVKHSFQKNLIQEKYGNLIKEAFENVCGFSVELQIISGEDTDSDLLIEDRINLKRADGNLKCKTHYDYTFDTFIVGPTNRYAHATAQAVADKPGDSYNPLFIYGNSGLGKTHLLNAICYRIQEKDPGAVIVLVSAEDFTTEFLHHLKNNTVNIFQDKYRKADVLLVDDVHFLIGKEQTQEAFFHIFNALHAEKKQMVFTSDRAPKEIPKIEERLLSRFEWGLLADIQAPEFETRIAIIKRKAELLGFEMPDHVVEFIAEKIKKNIRQLESTVRKINAYRLLDNIQPSIHVAQNAVKDIITDNKPVGVTIENIITEVSRTTGVPEDKIRSKDKTAKVSFARQLAMYIIREMTGISMKEIGAQFGGRDYSTTIYAINQIKNQLSTDSNLQKTIEMITKNVKES